MFRSREMQNSINYIKTILHKISIYCLFKLHLMGESIFLLTNVSGMCHYVTKVNSTMVLL